MGKPLIAHTCMHALISILFIWNIKCWSEYLSTTTFHYAVYLINYGDKEVFVLQNIFTNIDIAYFTCSKSRGISTFYQL